jgi:hypothetical protein
VEFPGRSDLEWLFGMLGAMDGVENLDIRGDWTQMLRFWRGDRERERLCPALRKLVVYGGESPEPELAVFGKARHGVGLPLTATHILSGEGKLTET